MWDYIWKSPSSVPWQQTPYKSIQQGCTVNYKQKSETVLTDKNSHPILDCDSTNTAVT